MNDIQQRLERLEELIFQVDLLRDSAHNWLINDVHPQAHMRATDATIATLEMVQRALIEIATLLPLLAKQSPESDKPETDFTEIPF